MPDDIQTIARARTIADYRPQHDDNCEVRFCVCGFVHGPKAWSSERGAHDFRQALDCTCGLDQLLAQFGGGVAAPSWNLIAHLERQREFSERTFGPGARTAGVVDHIRKELKEIEADPADISEWIDVVLLALDGAWRAGHSPLAITQGIAAKQAKNEQRQWPDWRSAPLDQAIEHNRTSLVPEEPTP